MRVIDVHKTTYKVSDFVSWQKAGSLDLSPAFQRRSVWKSGAKSYFIDSLLRGYPVPIIFIRDRQTDLDKIEPVREVVDGQQRLRTVIGYIDRDLLTKGDSKEADFQISRTHNPDIAGKGFKELPETARRRLLDYQFSVHVLSSDVSDREVLQIFARMNATGVKLNPQELRNAEYFGELNTSVYESAFAQLDRWRDWGILSDSQISRMDEVELTSDIYLLMTDGIQSKTKGALDSLYASYDSNFAAKKHVENRFAATMEWIDDSLSNFVPGSSFSHKNVFFILFAIVYDGLFGVGSSLERTTSKRLPASFSDSIQVFAKQVADEKLPENVLDAFDTRRISTAQSRSTIISYFREKYGSTRG